MRGTDNRQTRGVVSAAGPVGAMSPSGRYGRVFRWRWPLALAAVALTAVAFAMLAVIRPQTVVYPTTDFARLPLTATAPTPAAPSSCGSLGIVNGSPMLVDQPCGSPASTFRVIGRVSEVSQCVHDADLTYSWSSGPTSGTVCLDYDWAAGQCLHIASDAVHKVDCGRHGAVQPEMAIIGAVDVSYCREGGIAHRVRHFTVCTLAGDKDCKGRVRGT